MLNTLQGNSNEDAKDTSPANTPLAITVGATDITDSRAFYSNYGPIVDIFAPGSNVTSAWNDGGIKTISGTSMATPAVAGMVAYFLNILGPKTSPETMSGYITMQASLLKLSNIRKSTFLSMFFPLPTHVDHFDSCGDLQPLGVQWRQVKVAGDPLTCALRNLSFLKYPMTLSFFTIHRNS